MLTLAHNPSHRACRRRIVNSNSEQFCSVLSALLGSILHSCYFFSTRGEMLSVQKDVFITFPLGYVKTIHLIQRVCILYVVLQSISVPQLLIVMNQLLVPL